MSEIRTVMHARADFPFFLKHVIGTKLAEFHYDAINQLWNPDGTLNRYLCEIWARGFLKTTIFSVYYPIWRLWREPGDFRACNTSSSMDQSKSNIEIVKNTIDTNEILMEMVPEKDRSAIWNKTEIKTIVNNIYFAKPFTDSSRGTHVDLLVCDDILRSKDITQDQIKEIFWAIFYPMVQTRKGQIVVVGTRLTTDDLLGDITGEDELGEKKHPEFRWKVYPACKIDDNGNLADSIWPEVYSADQLKEMRNAQGSLFFDREYLCNPMGGGASIFPADLIKSHLISTITNKPKLNCLYYCGVDVAISKDSLADFTVITVIEKDKNDICRMVKMERFKGVPPVSEEERKKGVNATYIKKIKDLHKVFHFRKILIEDRGLSQGLVIDAKADREIKLFVSGFLTNKNNKEELISHLLSGFQCNNLFILNNPIIIKELSAFGLKKDVRTGKETYEALGGHDDTVISLGLAYEAATVLSGGKASVAFV